MKINPPTFGFPQINKEKNRERDTDVKLGCLSHSPRAQAERYLPSASISDMYAISTKQRKKKEKQKGERKILRSEMGKRQ